MSLFILYKNRLSLIASYVATYYFMVSQSNTMLYQLSLLKDRHNIQPCTNWDCRFEYLLKELNRQERMNNTAGILLIILIIHEPTLFSRILCVKPNQLDIILRTNLEVYNATIWQQKWPKQRLLIKFIALQLQIPNCLRTSNNPNWKAWLYMVYDNSRLYWQYTSLAASLRYF